MQNELNQINEWQAAGEKVVFTNGCFDILHLGHVEYLAEAKNCGDKLVVAINSDESVKRLEKGAERPVNTESTRLKIIAALKSVDLAFIFNDDTPLEVIELIKPNILVKGADYSAEETDTTSPKYIVGSKEVLEYGGAVKTIQLTEGFSTTKLIQKIKRAY